MLIEFGHYCLIFAFILCLTPVLARVQAFKITQETIVSITYWTVSIQFISLLVAFLVLIYGFLISDFSVQSVAFHSNVDTPWLYKITAVWGHHEGSMVLWVLIFSGYMVAFMRDTSIHQEIRKYGLFLLNTLLLMFLFYTLFASNPFQRLIPFPINSGEFNPLLQDPGMAIHPPLLFMGYIGFSIPFALSILSLLKPGSIDQSALKKWALIPWGFLTLGITIGSFWAYYELGWGGWWFWDPVENASLLPWLGGTILLHTSFLAPKSTTFYRFYHFISLLTFLLCLFGFLLIRSGILTSVHSFSVDASRGIFLSFIFLSLLIFTCFVWIKSPKIANKEARFSFVSKTTPLIFQNIMFVYLVFILLFAMVYPLINAYLMNTPIAVGQDFYIQTMGYPFLGAVIIMIFSFDFHKKGISRKTLGYATLIGLFFIILNYNTPKPLSDTWASLLGISSALVLIISTLLHFILSKTTVKKSAAFSHFCIGLILLGACGNTLWSKEKLALMTVGETLKIQDDSLTLESITPKPYSNYLAYEAVFFLGENNKLLKPERRLYYTPKIEHSESALSWQGAAIYYVILGETSDQENWMVRVYYTPLVFLVWLGGILLGLSILWYGYRRRWRHP